LYLAIPQCGSPDRRRIRCWTNDWLTEDFEVPLFLLAVALVFPMKSQVPGQPIALGPEIRDLGEAALPEPVRRREIVLKGNKDLSS
jgi:hypothetical protein